MLNGSLVTHTQPVQQDSFLPCLPTHVQSNNDYIRAICTKQYRFTCLNHETSTHRYFINEKDKNELQKPQKKTWIESLCDHNTIDN